MLCQCERCLTKRNVAWDKESTDDIAAPAHYVEGRTIEPRDAIIDWSLSWYLGNVVKYVARAGRKGDALQDLRKAQQYIGWEIERLEEEQ